MANVYDSTTGFIYNRIGTTDTAKVVAYAGSSDNVTIPASVNVSGNVQGWNNGSYIIDKISSFLTTLPSNIKTTTDRTPPDLRGKVPATITIPNSITSVADGALANSIIISVIYGGSLSTTIVGTGPTTGLAHYADGTTLKKYYQRAMPSGSVAIPNGVTSIGANAFEGSTRVTGVTIPASLTSIGAQAFKSSGLMVISIPSTVTTIVSSAFEGCTSLEYIYAADPAKVASITSAGTNTYICSGTTDITLNKYIGTAPAVTIPSKIPSTVSADNVQIIGVGCFKDLAITSVTIPASVTSIGASAFEGCNSLTTITIPASVTSIGASALATTSLISVIYGGSLSTAIVGTTATSGLAHYDGTTLKKYYPRAMVAGTVTIPASVTSIGASAFEGSTLVTGVTIPASLTSIGASAFKSTGLTIVTIPASVTTIGASAFEGCTELLSVDILRTTAFTTLGADILKSCTKLQGIKVGEAAVAITDAVFGSTGTTRVYLYTGRTLLKYFPRGSPNNLHFVTDGEKYVGTSVDVTFATIAAGAFSGVGQLQKLTIRGSTTIKSGAFTGCTNLYGIVVIGGTLEENSVSNSLTSTGYILVDSGTIGNGADGTNPVFPSTADTAKRVVNSGFNSTYTNLFGSGYGNRTSYSSKPVYVNEIGPDTFDKKYIDNTRYTNLKNFFTSSAVVLDTSYLDSVIESDTLSDSNTGLTATIAGNREDLIKSINQKVKSINFAIDEIKDEQNRNNRHSYFFSQDNYINVYRNRVALILYYIVFILLALSLYLNRESYSIVMIVVLLIIFAVLPFVIKYITRFAYNQFLNLLKLFYDGNVRYTNTKIE